jgi:hypothetical protein
MLYAQEENSLKGKTGPIIIATTGNDPIILLDGLILSKIDYLKLNIDESYSKKFKIKALSEKEAKKEYGITNKDGIVEIKTNLLYVLDNEYLTSESEKKLSKLTQGNILDMKVLKKEDAIKEYGKFGRNGAFIIKTKK